MLRSKYLGAASLRSTEYAAETDFLKLFASFFELWRFEDSTVTPRLYGVLISATDSAFFLLSLSFLLAEYSS